MDDVDAQVQALLEDGSIVSIQNEEVEFNWPLFVELHPMLAREIWLEHRAEIDGHLFSLADKGYVNLEVIVLDDGTFDLEVSLTELGVNTVNGNL